MDTLEGLREENRLLSAQNALLRLSEEALILRERLLEKELESALGEVKRLRKGKGRVRAGETVQGSSAGEIEVGGSEGGEVAARGKEDQGALLAPKVKKKRSLKTVYDVRCRIGCDSLILETGECACGCFRR